jgi:tRNA 2-thiouridine synthesizing protein A
MDQQEHDGGLRGGSHAHGVARAGDAQARGQPDAEWDAGDMGCGELVLELRMRLKALQPGQLFKLTARDPGAIEDLPAWCRMTGQRLVAAAHPIYLIARKED